MDVLSQQLRTSWPQLGRRPTARESARHFIARYPQLGLDGAADLCDVVGACERNSGRTQSEKAEIISALLRDADDAEIRQALVVVLIPGFHSQAAQLARSFGQTLADSGVDEMITTGVEIIDRWAGQERAYAGPDILSATRSKVRREILKSAERARIEWGSNDAGFLDFFTNGAAEIPADFYRAELAAFEGTVHDRAARMKAAAVYERASWPEIGQLEGLSPRSARREAQTFVIETGVLRLS
jgi:hypothetical protein